MRSLVVHMDMYSEPGPDGLVFPALEGGPLRRSNFRRRVWVLATQNAGLTGFRFHDLRHTAATSRGRERRPTPSAHVPHRPQQRCRRDPLPARLDGQDADIADYLDDLAITHRAADRDQLTPRKRPHPLGHAWGTTLDRRSRIGGRVG